MRLAHAAEEFQGGSTWAQRYSRFMVYIEISLALYATALFLSTIDATTEAIAGLPAFTGKDWVELLLGLLGPLTEPNTVMILLASAILARHIGANAIMKAPPIFRPFFQEVIHQLAALEDPRIQAMVEAHMREQLTAKVREEVSARKDAAFNQWLEEQRAAGIEFDESNPPPTSNGATNGKNAHDSSG